MSMKALNDLREKMKFHLNEQPENLEDFLAKIVILLKEYKSSIEHLLNTSPPKKNANSYSFEKKFLEFIVEVDIKQFALGSTGHDFMGLFGKLLNEGNKTLPIDFFEELFGLIKESIIFSSSKICPYCRGDQLQIYINKYTFKIYEHCPSCFSTWSDQNIERLTEDCFPADIKVLYEKGYM